jgi:hypothetical protein
MTCELYRHFDKDGKLLYVGISLNTLKRIRDHKSQSTWFDSVVRIEIERYPSREEALIAEERAIVEEKPLLNLRYAKRWGAASRGPEKQKIYEEGLAEAKAKGIRVSKRSASVRWQIEMAEKGVQYPYGIGEQFKWEREQERKLQKQ